MKQYRLVGLDPHLDDVCQVWAVYDGHNRIATGSYDDMKLFAASPALLKSCKTLVELGGSYVSEMADDWNEAVKQAEAAISQAEEPHA